MVKIENYECDRCHKHFSLPDGVVPMIEYTEQESEESITLHLCPDCNNGMCLWLMYPIQFEEVTKKIALENNGENKYVR